MPQQVSIQPTQVSMSGLTQSCLKLSDLFLGWGKMMGKVCGRGGAGRVQKTAKNHKKKPNKTVLNIVMDDFRL